MPDLSLRQFLQRNRFGASGGIRHRMPSTVHGSLRDFLALSLFQPDRLTANQQLGVSDELISNNGRVNLLVQSDGNIVLYRTMFDIALWDSNTVGASLDHVTMEAEGNLVAYSRTGAPVWATETSGHPGAWCVVQDD